MYYTGHFKGTLTVNGVTLAQGEGLEDLFWVKTSPTGQIIKHKTFSSPNSDYALSDGLAMGSANQLYFISWSLGDVRYGDAVINAYQNGTGKFMNTVTRIDTAGNIKWVRRTNLNLLKVFAAQNLVHVVGRISTNTGAIKSEDSTILDSVGKPGLVYMIYDTAGHFLSKKVITGEVNALFTLQNLSGYSDGTLLLSFQLQGNNAIHVNGSKVSLPSTNGQYHILIKTDTSFTAFRTKILNPLLHQIYGTGTSTLTSHLASDSLYTVLNVLSGSPYSINGFTLPFNQNMLVVLDSTLVAKRAISLGASFVATYAPSVTKRRIYFRSIAAIGNQLYLTGQYVGINEAPLNLVQPRDTTVPIIGDATGTVDLNGPSKSFIARTSLGLANNTFNWIGDHREYETATLYPSVLHGVNANRIAFLMNKDNVWNPWVADTSLFILSGKMQRNADRPEVPQMVSFFSDGGKVILSYASGKTALDTSTNVPSNSLRRDIFLACFNPDSSVRWHHRIESTLFQPSLGKMIVKNGKAWFFANFVGSQNDSNFIRVGNQTYNVNVNASLLCSIDSAGNITALNLPNALYKNGIIQNFSFFSNGDLALSVNTNFPISIPGFSPAPGFYILRLNPNNGALIDTRKLSGSAVPSVSSIEIDMSDNLYIAAIVNLNTVPSSRLYMYSSTSVVDSVLLTNNTEIPLHVSLLKMNWNKIYWVKRFFGNAGATPGGPTSLFLINNHPTLFVKSLNNNQSLSWESQLIYNGPYTNTAYTSLVSVDANGSLIRSKYLPLPITHFLKKGSGENLFVSGASNGSLQIDTIQIGHAGATDGISVVLDSNLVARRSFRIASPFTELMYDMDIFRDSVVALTYSAQSSPTLLSNRAMAQNIDYEPDAYVTTLTLGPNTTLPVRWLGFEAKKQGQAAVLLHWQVSNQVNNDYFEIQHNSGDGRFKSLGRVQALSVRNDYDFLHLAPEMSKTNYYRLKQVDKDGRYTHSAIRLVTFNNESVFNVAPNPATDVLHIQTNKDVIVVHIYDNIGRKVTTIPIAKGGNDIDISHLAKGTYLLMAESNDVVLPSRKFIKQ